MRESSGHGPTDRTKHIAAKDEGAEVFDRSPCEHVVPIDRSYSDIKARVENG